MRMTGMVIEPSVIDQCALSRIFSRYLVDDA